MNFFEHQAVARRNSRRLIVLFALAVVGIVLAVDLALLAGLGGIGGAAPAQLVGVLVFASIATVAVIGLASLYRVSSLRGGGGEVARELGATPVAEDTSDFQYRRLRNVVEEIAIASGVPVPEIYVLEHEAGINAFAAGYTPADAAVTVTRGALERLNRDELQGVIAHEFSHVLNGDMRLNIRLMGVLFGILVLAIIGRKVLVLTPRGRNSKGAAPVLVTALALMVVGYIGLFFGRLIKAGVSRQREYLADASAVQFTRQTRGIAGALKKIGGLAAGSQLSNKGKTEEVAHMLFGDGVGYSALFATHPPLLRRIQALEPSFSADGLEQLAARWAGAPPSGIEEDRALGLDAGIAPLPQQREELAVLPAAVVAQVGTPQADDYRRAGAIVEAIPAPLRAAARQLDQAMPLVLGLLIRGTDGDVHARQRAAIVARQGEAIADAAFGYAHASDALHPMLRLPLAALAFPLLRRRPRPELETFADSVQALVHADGRVELSEYCLAQLIRSQVLEALDPAGNWKPGRHKLVDLRVAVGTLFSLLAQAGHDDAAAAQRAFHTGIERTLAHQQLDYAPPAAGVVALDAIWPTLDALDPTAKALLVEGLVACVSTDGRVAVAEAELLRTVCGVLHCPLPPMLERT